MKTRWIYWMAAASLLLTACQVGVQAPEASGSAAPEVVQASLASVDAEDNLHLFDYDPSLPLDIIEDGRWQQDGQTWIDFTYASPMGGRVPARLVIPQGEGPFPAVMIQHGSMGHIEDLDWPAQLFASFGAVVIMIEDPYSRPGGWRPSEYMGATWPYYTDQDLEVKFQSIIDMRRAVDILVARPEVDPERMAYYGISYGAAMGGLLSGVEDRFQAYVLQVGDGGLVEHTSDPGPDGLPVHFSPGWAEMMWPTEPLHFIGQASAPILFLNGLQDVNVLPTDALRFQAAAGETKTVYWYDADHGLTPLAFYNAAQWLQPYLGAQLLWFAPNYRATASILDWGLTLWMLAILVSLGVLWRWSGKMNLSLGWRILWSFNLLYLGPLGLGLFSWLHRQGSESKVRRRLGATINSVTALSTGLFLGNLTQQILASDQDGLGLLALYLVFLIVSRLVHRLVGVDNPSRWIAHLLSANVYWTAAVLGSNLVNQWFATATILDPRSLWSLGLITLAGSLVTYPLHAWFLQRGLERWSCAGLESPDRSVLGKLHWALSGGLGLASFLLVFGSLVWLIVTSTGLSLAEIAQALQGG